MGPSAFGQFYLSSVSIAFENLKQGFVRASSNASLSNVNLFNVLAFVSILSDGPIVVSFSLKYQIEFVTLRTSEKTDLRTIFADRCTAMLVKILKELRSGNCSRGVSQNFTNVHRCIPTYCVYVDTHWLALRLFLTLFFMSCSHVFAVPGIGLK